jgi:hypothetical protein
MDPTLNRAFEIVDSQMQKSLKTIKAACVSCKKCLGTVQKGGDVQGVPWKIRRVSDPL